MAEQSIVLSATGGELAFAIRENAELSRVRMCGVFLTTKGTRTPIGIADLTYLRTHLLAFLRNQPKKLTWVFSLMEIKGAVYGECSGESLLLRFQDVNAKWYAELRLTQLQRAAWIAALNKIELAS